MAYFNLKKLLGIIKNNHLISVGRPKVVSFSYEEKASSASDKDIDEVFMVIDMVNEYNMYAIMELPYDIYKDEVVRFLVLINDHNTIKDKDKEWFYKFKKEVVEGYTSQRYDLMFDAEYTIIESPELWDLISQWFDLTNDDYEHRRFITV